MERLRASGPAGGEGERLVLALDTTTRAGSAALLLGNRILGEQIGDASRTHGERLPGELLDLLRGHGRTLRDVTLYAVAIGPGSFTGLRVGIAAMQGLAFAHRRGLVGVSALDALATAAAARLPERPATLAVWMDAQRGEVFAAAYRLGEEPTLIDGPLVAGPEDVSRRWRGREWSRGWLVGDGAVRYRPICEGAGGRVLAEPLLAAAAVARLAAARAGRGSGADPASIRPLYVRRPDAELARDRRDRQGAPQAASNARETDVSRSHVTEQTGK